MRKEGPLRDLARSSEPDGGRSLRFAENVRSEDARRARVRRSRLGGHGLHHSPCDILRHYGPHAGEIEAAKKNIYLKLARASETNQKFRDKSPNLMKFAREFVDTR